jgi:ATP-dependent DNA helicase PIF1
MFGLGIKCKNCRKIINEELEYCSQDCAEQHMNQQIDSTLTLQEKIEIRDLMDNHNEISAKDVEKLLENVPFAFLTGRAGTGKTTAVRKMADKNSKILLTASTGIAAVNLDSSTIHSRLGFFNLKSLEDSYARGFLQTKLHRLAEKYETLVLDECSMLNASALDIIVSAISEMIIPINFYIVGDLAQLSPVTGKDEPKAEYIIKANNWELFEKNTIKLEKIWRQDNTTFLNAINAIRESNGKKAVELLKACGVEFKLKLQENFDGTTIIAVNKGVDEFNKRELTKLVGDLIRVSPDRRGRQKSEWDSQIPHEMRFKVGAYVMILSNDTENWSYANGDCGTIEAYYKSDDSFAIRLKRNNELVNIKKIIRKFLTDKEPSQSDFNSMYMPTVDHVTKDWIIGEIKYHPLRLAWASTVHRSQGLTLDKVQVDINANFFSYPSMIYVAMSRARTPEGLIIVGNERDFIRKCVIAKEVQKWV